MFRRQAQSVGARVGIAVVAAAVAALLTAVIPGSRDTPFLPLFLLAVLASAWFAGWLGGLLCTALSILCVAFAYIPPYGSFGMPLMVDVIRLAVFAAVSLLITGFLAVARERAGMQAPRTTNFLS
jgi:K+-sensing histidine kinase KdpD